MSDPRDTGELINEWRGAERIAGDLRRPFGTIAKAAREADTLAAELTRRANDGDEEAAEWLREM